MEIHLTMVYLGMRNFDKCVAERIKLATVRNTEGHWIDMFPSKCHMVHHFNPFLTIGPLHIESTYISLLDQCFMTSSRAENCLGSWITLGLSYQMQENCQIQL